MEKLSNEDMDNNLQLWASVSTTDRKYTQKAPQHGGYTSISAQYQLREATKVFGPYGLNWGLESINIDHSLVAGYGFIIIRAIFFYTTNKQKASFPINNAWPIKVVTKKGLQNDPDFMKKAETNTISKALSKLGFSADIFMGQFDDVEYIKEQKDKLIEDIKIQKDTDKAKKAREAWDVTNEAIKDMNNAKTHIELEGLFKAAYRKIDKVGDKGMVRSLISNKDAFKQKLSKEEGA